MIMLSINPIKAFNDNYIWCVEKNGEAIIVDPGDAAPVLLYLEQQQLKLNSILITHHHYDHVGGLELLCDANPSISVYGPHNDCAYITQRVSHGDRIKLFDGEFEIVEVPGHTLDHIAYFSLDVAEYPLLFCGDTLFAGGCGRLFEGTPEQMLASLGLIRELPSKTAVFCAHEYTLANLNFAKTVDPNNIDLQKRYLDAQASREQNIPTVPSEMALELLTNPFLRTNIKAIEDSVVKHAQLKQWSEKDIFAKLREWKDHF
ncbi:MAG: hydroxyacylglutathione hydrolase [Zhongshania sp.]|jgi:hydroxyacylglutathione hydrolase